MRQAVRKFKETVEINSSTINKLKSHKYFSVSLLFFSFLVASCFYLWQQATVVSLVKDISQLKKENHVLLDSKKKLYSDIASLSTSSRVTQYAVDTLGLRLVEADKMLTLMPRNVIQSQPDKLNQMLTALKRVADFLPVIEETRAKAGAVENITVDSTVDSWGKK